MWTIPLLFVLSWIGASGNNQHTKHLNFKSLDFFCPFSLTSFSSYHSNNPSNFKFLLSCTVKQLRWIIESGGDKTDGESTEKWWVFSCSFFSEQTKLLSSFVWCIDVMYVGWFPASWSLFKNFMLTWCLNLERILFWYAWCIWIPDTMHHTGLYWTTVADWKYIQWMKEWKKNNFIFWYPEQTHIESFTADTVVDLFTIHIEER